MKAKFEVEFLEPAEFFLEQLDLKTKRKIIYNIDKSRYVNDPKLFKKLDEDIWEFRTKYGGNQHRLLAFWVKQGNRLSLVIATHGFIKKDSKIPKKEIEKARDLMKEYLKR